MTNGWKKLIAIYWPTPPNPKLLFIFPNLTSTGNPGENTGNRYGGLLRNGRGEREQ